MTFIRRMVTTAAALCAFAAAAPAEAGGVNTRVEFVNSVTGLSVKAVIQNVGQTTIDSYRGADMNIYLGVPWLGSNYAVFVAEFEGLEGPHVKYCTVHIEIRASNPFTGPAYVDECRATVMHRSQGRWCTSSADRVDESTKCHVSVRLS